MFRSKRPKESDIRSLDDPEDGPGATSFLMAPGRRPVLNILL